MTTENEASKAERNLDNHDLHAWDYEEYWTQQLSNLDKPEPAAETPTVVASPYAMERKNIADSQTMEEFEQFSLEELKDYASIYLAKKETLATSVKEKDVPSTPIASQRLRGSTIDASLKEKENMKEPIASQSLSGSTIVNDPEQQVSNEKQPETPQSIENQSMPSATPQKKNPCPQMRSRIMQQIPNQPA
jgi:hypothetical protein